MAKQKQDDNKKQLQKERQQLLELNQKMKAEKMFKREADNKERLNRKHAAEDARIKKQKVLHSERCNRAFAIIQRKPKHTWKTSDYRTVLMAMKKKSDAPLPSTLTELLLCYDEWKDRVEEFMVEQNQEHSSAVKDIDNRNSWASKIG